jgi:hypothetical protein
LDSLVGNHEQKKKNDENAKKKTRRLGIKQRQQLIKQCHLRKNVTQETMKEIAGELHLPQAIVKVF